ncbi:hypothetical protein L917_21347 [Phytophthora nicotianae]|uniref:Uncharacterized protein n=2 Tax=Phytophthora nicotianae TaxID=4792 RepID=W2PEU7_PHYN3|nr:hypothetical protein PPTG_24462 [Phytophthora nicotianae INRA-310]ETL77730.1 hypothetical protein L917_21347 [Phytophthora nicotianae]ETM99180.1 hypothetical protein PPTG_24462 [Phytophthora nicotianae INRA-310]
MNPSQSTSDKFPCLVGVENFDVWKTRACATLDDKRLHVYAKKPDYDGISDEENHDESDEDLKPQSDSYEDSGDNIDTPTEREDLPAIRSFGHRQGRKRKVKR